MSATTYTLLKVVQLAGFRVSNFKDKVDSVENPDIATENMVECVNEVLRELAMVKPLPWLNGRYVITTVDDHTTGTVTVANADETVTGSSAAFTAAMVGRAFATNAKNAMYRIGSYTDSDNIELEEAWSDDSASGEGYTIAQDRYDLPADYDDLLSATIEGPSSHPLKIISPSEMDTQRLLQRGKILSVGSPRYICVYDIASSGVRQIELDPFPDDEYRVILKYKKVPSSLSHDNAVVPMFDKNINVLINGVVARWKSIQPVTPEDKAEFERWKRNDLTMYVAFDREKTDEMAQLVPDNVTRSSVPMSGTPDWGQDR